MNLKCSIDGDQLCITGKGFINLQESKAVFIPRGSETGRAIEELEELRLMIVRHDPDLNIWIVDEDSRHHLEVDGSHDVFELQVVNIRPPATRH